MLAPRRYALAGTLVIALSWLVGCSKDAQAPERPVASVTLTPELATLFVAGTLKLSARLRDANGALLTGRPITWASDDAAVATVDPDGTVQGAGPGSAAVTATSEGVSGFATIRVNARVAAVTVAPAVNTVAVGRTVRLAATVKDAAGNALTDRPVTWTSSNLSVASVSATGVVTGVRADPTSVTITATSESVSGSAAITVVTTSSGSVSFASVEAGAYHTCGRTADGAAYCWGYNGWGQLGDGSIVSSLVPGPVTGGFTYASVSLGGIHACGLTAGGAAYCWGADVYASLGAGAPGPELCSSSTDQFPCSSAPLAVAGGLTFASLSAGWGPTCALTANGTAYCWGDNGNGALGIGSDTANIDFCAAGSGQCSETPLKVAGGLQFSTVGAANLHACGLTAAGAAYCWGDNSFGELGIGANAATDTCNSSPCSRTPVAVAGGLTFTALRAGLFLTCGRATGGAWYCWGSNNFGQLGNGAVGPELCQGTNPCSSVPVAVASGAGFETVFPGYRHSCAITPGGVASCWGWNASGQLGDGTTSTSVSAVAVTGGLSFTSMSPFTNHTCAISSGGVAYCWGGNQDGELGDGTNSSSSTPVQVAGQPAAAGAAVRVRGVVPRASVRRTPYAARP